MKREGKNRKEIRLHLAWILSRMHWSVCVQLQCVWLLLCCLWLCTDSLLRYCCCCIYIFVDLTMEYANMQTCTCSTCSTYFILFSGRLLYLMCNVIQYMSVCICVTIWWPYNYYSINTWTPFFIFFLKEGLLNFIVNIFKKLKWLVD